MDVSGKGTFWPLAEIKTFSSSSKCQDNFKDFFKSVTRKQKQNKKSLGNKV